MMIATWRGRSRTGGASDLHDLGFLALCPGVDGLGEAIGQPLQGVQLAPLLVLREVAVAQCALEVIGGLAPMVADLDAGLLGPATNLLDHLPAPLLGERRDVEPHHRSVHVRDEADVAARDGLLDRGQHRSVPGLDDDQVRIGRADAGDLVERSRRAVVVDRDALDEGRRGPPGADTGEVALHGIHGALHLGLDLAQRLVRHASTSPVISVPICSPRTARAMLPGCVMSNTTIGMSLSIARLTAVASSAWSRLASRS